MYKFRDILCIDFPPLIRIELQERYSSWSSRAAFQHSLKTDCPHPSLIVCPAETLFQYDIPTSVKIIAFGSPVLLERAFIRGASDYLKNPWSCGELLARSSRILNFKNIHIHGKPFYSDGSRFLFGSRALPLTAVQTKILSLLADYPNEILSCKDLSCFAQPEKRFSINALYVQISGIRRVLKESMPGIYGKDLSIKNSQGRGYMLQVAVDNLCKTVDKL